MNIHKFFRYCLVTCLLVFGFYSCCKEKICGTGASVFLFAKHDMKYICMPEDSVFAFQHEIDSVIKTNFCEWCDDYPLDIKVITDTLTFINEKNDSVLFKMDKYITYGFVRSDIYCRNSYHIVFNYTIFPLYPSPFIENSIRICLEKNNSPLSGFLKEISNQLYFEEDPIIHTNYLTDTIHTNTIQSFYSVAEDSFAVDAVVYDNCLIYNSLNFYALPQKMQLKLVYSCQHGIIYIINNQGYELKRIF